MSRITEYLQQREKAEDTSTSVPGEETLSEYFQNQVRVLQTSTKYSKTGEVTPIFGTRHVSETDRAVVACNDYLRMGAGRTMVELHENYVEAKKRRESIPTTSQQSLYEWSSRFGWASRCREYDAEIDGIIRQAEVIDGVKIMTEGYGLERGGAVPSLTPGSLTTFTAKRLSD